VGNASNAKKIPPGLKERYSDFYCLSDNITYFLSHFPPLERILAAVINPVKIVV
jgi:hypothetical protein